MLHPWCCFVTLKGDWEDGKLADGKFYFRDNLDVDVGDLDSWEYCTEDDRRFQSEIKTGR